MGVYQKKTSIHIKASPAEVWKFFCDPNNLKKLTPEGLGLDVKGGESSGDIYPGMVVWYKVRPMLGIPVTWLTEITHVKDESYFIDEQRTGPYAIWHHEHHIYKTNQGTMMDDIVTYKPPFGILGKIANTLFIKKKLDQIFDYRKEAITKIFGLVE